MNNNEEGMEKFGVEEGAGRLEKFANERGEAVCPTCSKKAVRHGSTFLCPDHGSEPFEQG